MPIYEEECPKCGNKDSYLSFRITEDTRECSKCGSAMERLYSLSAVSIFDGFSTRNISPNGENMHIRSKRELSSLCHEFGVVPAMDAPPPTTRFNQPS